MENGAANYSEPRPSYDEVLRENAALKARMQGLQTAVDIARQRGANTRRLNQQTGRKRKSRHFVKVYKYINQEALWGNLFTSAEKEFLFTILPFVGYRDGLLRDERKRLLNMSDLGKLCGWSRETLRNVIKSLTAKDVLSRERVGREKHIRVYPHRFQCGEG